MSSTVFMYVARIALRYKALSDEFNVDHIMVLPAHIVSERRPIIIIIITQAIDRSISYVSQSVILLLLHNTTQHNVIT